MPQSLSTLTREAVKQRDFTGFCHSELEKNNPAPPPSSSLVKLERMEMMESLPSILSHSHFIGHGSVHMLRDGSL